MRLINTYTLELAGPFLPTESPSYAILSHTWGPDELCHQDMANILQHKHRKGYIKIKRFCEHALEAGYIYGWVDTVCIDKTSSAELSEAINSMYRWYAKSAICYAVLEDLHTDKNLTTLSGLKKCRWFSRGWTLQELIAPDKLIFLNADWIEVGSKTDFAENGFGHMVEEITTIDGGTLLGLSSKRLSIAQRMSWASERQTSRPEDTAYSLFGLFGVTLPLLYGEGGKQAFIRLQEEILRNTDDHTIFAWSTKPVRSSINSEYYGLLAPSPVCFSRISSSKYLGRMESSIPIPIRDNEAGPDHAITSRGVYLKGLANPSCTLLTLNCRPGNSIDMLCTIPIARLRSGPNDFARLADPPEPGLVPISAVKEHSKQTEIYVRSSIHEPDFREQYLVDYMQFVVLPSDESGYGLGDWYPYNQYNHTAMLFQASPFPNESCGGILLFKHPCSSTQSSFAVAIFGEYDAEKKDWAYQDFVGVYKTTKGARDFYLEEFAGWFNNGKQGEVSGAATRIVRDGLEAWKLDEETFVRVVIGRKKGAFVGNIAMAAIYAGSWEQDILHREEE